MTRTPSGLLLRPFEPTDLEALQAIRREAFAPVFASFRSIVGDSIAAVALAGAEAEQEKLLEDICAGNSGYEILVATEGATIVAFVSWKGDSKSGVGEIGLNAVHPERSGRGVGAFMYARVIERMKAAGMRVATVGTGGDESHAPARRAYEKAGFGVSIPSVFMYRLLG